MEMRQMELECHKKIKALHVFIESWLTGRVEKSKQEFRYFEDELDAEFIIIHPSGDLQTKPDITSGFWGAHGGQSKNFIVEIRNIKMRYASQDICIMNYEEWQTDEKESVRISTVVFRKSKSNNKISWLHLHETWMPTR